MKKVKPFVLLVMALITFSLCDAQDIRSDIRKLEGTWEGSLTYLDYTSGKPYTMPANVEIKQLADLNQFGFAMRYPNEPNANSVDTLIISADGKLIDKANLKSRKVLANGDIEIVTEEMGKDGNDHKPATFRHTYTIGATSFSKRKEVQFVGETQWIKRHEYSYKKKV